MRLSFVLAIAAALTTSISASDAGSENCPFFCKHDRNCIDCIPDYGCVSMSSLRSEFKHMTDQRGSSYLYATTDKRLVWCVVFLLSHRCSVVYGARRELLVICC
ncbi:uncharacterized protein EDB91DRAFT_227501 [Suillus paluster]|uniref:uncharacterized protein n=1 Tax=Suillus paluster TaxID=48578 RepID=UPI001B864805|nr:uncharacterized protein EDB91DRAFT_227501 [Suillus paluster]KAG1722045.1 hypothetical protein EDB91DRAFT_227501 [Suillus paluster]